MNKTVIIALLMVGLLFVAGCSSSATGSVPRGAAPSGPVPAGGGCGIAAPADIVPAAVAAGSADSVAL